MVKHGSKATDFRNKKVKVGKKQVKSLSDTQIDVKSKKLIVPAQQQITIHIDQGDQREVLASHMVGDLSLHFSLSSSTLFDHLCFLSHHLHRDNYRTTQPQTEPMRSSLLELSSPSAKVQSVS